MTMRKVPSQEEAIKIVLQDAPIWGSSVVVPAGADDCGVLDVGSSRYLAVTTDYTNFRPLSKELGLGDLLDRGRLLVYHNISDLLSSGAKPIAFLSSLGIPRSLPVSDLQRLGKGISEGARTCDVVLLGGDTKESQELALCGIAIGVIRRKRVWAQSYARPGDDLFLSGPIGGVSASIWTTMCASERVKKARHGDIRRALLRPTLPIELARGLRAHSFRIGASDISDGLGSDLRKLLAKSRVSAIVEGEKIPVPFWVERLASESGFSSLEMAFGLGGDGQFIFSVARRNRKIVEELGGIRIGSVVEESNSILLYEEKRTALPDFGHHDFEEPRSSERFIKMVGSRFQE